MKFIQVKIVARVSDDWMDKCAHELLSSDGHARLDIALKLRGDEETRTVSLQQLPMAKEQDNG